jgi:hypothetical protein
LGLADVAHNVLTSQPPWAVANRRGRPPTAVRHDNLVINVVATTVDCQI